MIRFVLFIFLSITLSCQNKVDQEAIDDILKAHHELNVEYADKDKSPLEEKDFLAFRNLDFYEPNLDFRVIAGFEKNQFPVPFEMATTTDRVPVYQKYGTLHFQLKGKTFQLPVYQNLKLMEDPEYSDYLFVPFTDLTNGNETYGGGRYLDLHSPLEGEVLLDFNKAYNPYCAYNHKYSCVIPPKENHLDIKVEAGVKKFHD